MSEPPSFHLRLPPTLKAKLQDAARGKNSLNTEIVERLDRTFDPDHALRLAELLRPYMMTLSDADQARLVKLAADAAAIVFGKRGRRR